MSGDDRLEECKGRAGLYGLATGSITFAGFHFAQEFATRRMRNRNKRLFFASSLFFASAAAYIAIDARLKECARRHEISRFDGLAKFKH